MFCFFNIFARLELVLEIYIWNMTTAQHGVEGYFCWLVYFRPSYRVVTGSASILTHELTERSWKIRSKVEESLTNNYVKSNIHTYKTFKLLKILELSKTEQWSPMFRYPNEYGSGWLRSSNISGLLVPLCGIFPVVWSVQPSSRTGNDSRLGMLLPMLVCALNVTPKTDFKPQRCIKFNYQHCMLPKNLKVL